MHYCLCVIHPDGTDVAEYLQPFDENLQVQKYVEDGEEYWENPNSKWDWYQIGGRWACSLRLKNGVKPTPDMYGKMSRYLDEDDIANRVDSALLNDIDMSIDMEAWNTALERWDKAMNGEIIGFFETKETLLRDYISKENYAAAGALFYFPYVIDHKGEWHQMWPYDAWDCNICDRIKWAQEFIQNFVRPLNPKRYRMTIVDIHR